MNVFPQPRKQLVVLMVFTFLRIWQYRLTLRKLSTLWNGDSLSNFCKVLGFITPSRIGSKIFQILLIFLSLLMVLSSVSLAAPWLFDKAIRYHHCSLTSRRLISFRLFRNSFFKRKPKKEFLLLLSDRFKAKLADWNGKFLSMADRLTYVK